MPPVTKAYASTEVDVIIGGHNVQGKADEDFVELEFPDQGEKQIGADGEFVWSFSPDDTARVTVRTKQTSSSNDVLWAQSRVSKATKTPISPFLMVDGTGRLVLGATNAFVQNYPVVTRGRTAGEGEWVYELSEISGLLGGNPAF